MFSVLAKLVLLGCTIAVPAQQTDRAKGGTGKSKLNAADVKAQIAKAEAYYKETLEIDKAPVHESDHFLVIGQWRGRSSALIAGDLERVYLKACTALELGKDPGPWAGKLVVFVLPEAKYYVRLIRITQRRKADEDEVGSHSAQATLVHVAARPSKVPGDFGVAGTACSHVSGLMAELKVRAALPEWLTEGFGRASTLHSGVAGSLMAERRKAAYYLTANKRSVNDIFTDNLKGDEMPVLRTSLMDYLAYSGRTAKLLPFLQGFAGDGKNNSGIESALKMAKANRQELSSDWERFAKSLK